MVKKKNNQKFRLRQTMSTGRRGGKGAKKTIKATKATIIVPTASFPEGAEVKKTRIRVIGVGGGGGSIVSEIATRIKGASFIVANTDSQALKAIGEKAAIFQFGENFTHGLGTGMNSQVAEEAAEAEKEKIKKILQGQDLVVLVATLGGGAGSGALPVFAKISRSLGNLTLGIFTLPFKFEGDKKMEIANASLEKLKSRLDAYTVVPNERIFQIVDKATPLVKAFSSINKILAKNLEGLIETVFEPGLINIDFADLRTILAGQGRLAYLNTVEVSTSENSAKETIERVLNSPLYPYGIRGAKGVLLNIAGEKELALAEVSQISETISKLVNGEAKIIFGISQGKKYQNLIKTTLLATGCKMIQGGEGRSRETAKVARKKVKKQSIVSVITSALAKSAYQSGRASPVAGKGKKISPKVKRKRAKRKKQEAKPVVQPQETVSPLTPSGQFAAAKEGIENQPFQEKRRIEVRKNALQVRRDVEEQEADMLEKEKVWETPAFLRKDDKSFTA
ncbi:MAG: cell division protein FtsZ [Candidatus Wildermuthbacteria bacterium]|nr:cell division protein FtsZ [Candidatus Wildermuthbacteria bacterium]